MVLHSPERHRTRGASPITAAQYEELRAFDAALHVGQRVMIRWTQGGDPVAYGQKTAGRVKRWQLTVAKRLYCSEFPEVPTKYEFLTIVWQKFIGLEPGLPWSIPCSLLLDSVVFGSSIDREG